MRKNTTRRSDLQGAFRIAATFVLVVALHALLASSSGCSGASEGSGETGAPTLTSTGTSTYTATGSATSSASGMTTSTGTSSTTGTGTGTSTGTGIGTGTDYTTNPAMVDMIFSAVNDERDYAGLPDFVFNDDLAAVAQAYAEVTAIGLHTTYRDNWDGKTPTERINQAGIAYVEAGEAGAVGPNHDGLVPVISELLINYPDLLLDPEMNEIGIGYAFFMSTC